MLNLLALAIFLGGCASSYGPRGVAGGYSDKPINSTTFFIRYDSAPLVGLATSHEQLEPLWDKRAEELCGSKDFYKETKRARLDANNHEAPINPPVILGVAYCNNKFLDTRRQAPDENFQQFIDLPDAAIGYKEITPLWTLLTDHNFEQLQIEILNLTNNSDENETIALLETFSRTNPAIEPSFNAWIKAYPNSFAPYYARSLYYQNFAWFTRGAGSFNQLSREQKEQFNSYSALAAADINKSLSLKPEFCPSHAHKLHVYTGMANTDKSAYKTIFDIAKSTCPNSIGIHKAFLRSLLPRWHGSKGEMRSFIDNSVKQNAQLKPLEALYIAEEGDQLLFSNSFDQAVAKYSEALSFGDFAYIYHQRGLALENAKRYVESLEDYDQAIKISPYYDDAYEGIARIFIAQNNAFGALAATTYLTTFNNQDASTFEIQGDIFYAMRRYNDAYVCYKKAEILSKSKAIHQHKIRMAQYQIDVRQKTDESKPLKTAI